MSFHVMYRAEQQFTPRAVEILSHAAKQVYGDTPIELIEASENETAIGFGVDSQVVTLSPKQIETAPHALTALTSAFQVYRDGPAVEETVEYTLNEYDVIYSSIDKPLTWDIEYAKDGRLLCIGVTDGERITVFTENFPMVARLLKQCYYLIGWNVKSDALHVWRQTGVRIVNWFDGMLAHHTLNLAARGHHGLQTVAHRMLGVSDWEEGAKEWAGRGKNTDYGKIPSEVLYRYNAYDVMYTHALYQRLLPQVLAERPFWANMNASHVLMDIEYNGVAIDVDYVKELDEKFEQEEIQAKARLPEGLNPNSPKQVKDWLHSQGAMVPNTAAGTLEEWGDVKEVAALLEYRKVNKKRSTYTTSYLNNNRNGILYPTFNLHGTSTGRLSSSNPNAQNVPSTLEMRRIFTVRHPDNVLIGADYKNAEARTVALLSDDPAYQALFQPGMPDYFDSMMLVAYPNEFKSLEEFQAFKEAEPEVASDMRRNLKTVVFGLSYGRQAPAIAQSLGIEVHEAQKIINDMFESLPRFAQWRREVQAAAVDPDKRAMLVTPFGRRFQTEVVSDRNYGKVQNEALAFLPQSTASDICLTAAVELSKVIHGKIVLLVHDEIAVETHKDHAEEDKATMERIMSQVAHDVFGDKVPFMVDAAIGRSWADVH